MKKIFLSILALTMSAMALTGCSSEEEAIDTTSADDTPVILNADFPLLDGNAPGLYKTLNVGDTLDIHLLYTPTAHSTVEWRLDGQKVAEGAAFKQAMKLAGRYVMDVVVTTTRQKSTSRTYMVQVQPGENDPQTIENLGERLVAPGMKTSVNGRNLSSVKAVTVGGAAVTGLSFSGDDANGTLTYTVPANVAAGLQRIVLKTADKEYGGGRQIVATAPAFKNDNFAGSAGNNVTMEGVNLDKVASVTLDGKAIEIAKKTATALTVVVPKMEAKGYALAAKDAAGKEVEFMSSTGLVQTAVFNITNEKTLWSGSFEVTWGTPFSELKTTFLSKVKVGTILRAYVAGNGQGTATTAWWNNLLTGEGDPNRGDFMINGDFVIELKLTQKSLDLLGAQDGFLIVGNGYTLKKVTIE